MAQSQIDRLIGDTYKIMKTLRWSLRGIPIRQGSFKKQHDNLARDVALLIVELDSARGSIT